MADYIMLYSVHSCGLQVTLGHSVQYHDGHTWLHCFLQIEPTMSGGCQFIAAVQYMHALAT